MKFDKDSIQFGLTVITFQVCLFFLFAFLATYDPTQIPADSRFTNEAPQGLTYPMFQDIHVMMFVGFGFLLVFPYLYSWSGVAFAFMLGAFVIQWSLLTLGFLEKAHHHNYSEPIELTVTSFIKADYCVAAILISYSGLLGRLSPFQYLMMAFLETIVYSVNEFIVLILLNVTDVGGSLTIHAFGAYFGLACSFAHQLMNKRIPKNHPTLHASYSSDLMAVIGTLFLWMYWPSFNGALLSGASLSRTITNTLLSMAASCFTTFAISKIFRGGVAVGGTADMMIHTWGALLTGSCAGTISTLGYIFLSPLLEKHLGLLDTAGIHNLHAMPGVLGGIISIFAAGIAKYSDYGNKVGLSYPMRGPSNATLAAEWGVPVGEDWSAARQAGAQACGLVVSVCFAIVSGFIVGLLLRLPFCNQIEEKKMYSDHMEFLVEEHSEPSSKAPEVSDEEDDEELKSKEQEG